VNNQPILIIFVYDIPNNLTSENITVPTSPTNSCRSIWKCKTVIFQLYLTIILIKQLLFSIISIVLIILKLWAMTLY